MQNFDGFNLHPALMRGVTDLGFSTPTPIQASGIPPALEGRDVLGAAATGSGKTAAFALPILQRLLATPRRGVTRALVLAPTRELAEQITEQFNKLARHTPIKAAAIYGGVGMHPQERSLRRGVEVIVACPGRLLDHMSRGGYARLGGLEVLVLDEADRMLDMGFLPDIRRILAILPKASQTLLFSATMPRPIAELAQTLQRNAVKLDIESPAAPAALVEQAIFQVRQDLKTALLLELLRGETIGNALVFTRTKHRADRVAQFLERNGVSVDRVHGDRTQFQRQQAVDGFRSGRTRVLVATDVAARGIDIKALSHVVNFDVPGQPDDYIHRVGRTGRAGVSGQAFTFVSTAICAPSSASSPASCRAARSRVSTTARSRRMRRRTRRVRRARARMAVRNTAVGARAVSPARPPRVRRPAPRAVRCAKTPGSVSPSPAVRAPGRRVRAATRAER